MMDNQLLIAEIEIARQSLISTVNLSFNGLLAHIEAANGTSSFDKDGYTAKVGEYCVPITSNPAIFAGRMPIFVAFGNELKYVMSWREVLSVVLERCNQDPIYHERLMDLRGKSFGKSRVTLSDEPDGMRKVAKIDENLYIEVHNGAKAMMYTLVRKILTAIQYDCSNISVIMKAKPIPIGGVVVG